jgi:hypothetical protein
VKIQERDEGAKEYSKGLSNSRTEIALNSNGYDDIKELQGSDIYLI